MKNNDILNVSGHLEIYKVYNDGKEEKIFSDKNTITSGMGVGLGLLYAGSGATNITSFQLRYFQLGVSGDQRLSPIGTYGVGETILVSALGQVDGVGDYRTDAQSDMPIVKGNLMAWNGGLQAVDGTYGNDWFFGLISDNTIKRVELYSITYILYVDRYACNNHTLNEIGLFMENPLGVDPKRSQLCAYRPFMNIAKTDDFALVFKWTLNF